MKLVTEERWISVGEDEGFAGYEVSSLGHARKTTQFPSGPRTRFLKTNPNGGGYPCISLCKRREDGTTLITQRLLHVLVANAFVPGFEAGLEVHHKDDDINNPRADNLEWVTSSKNKQLEYERRPRANFRRWNEADIRQMRAMKAAKMTLAKICAAFPGLTPSYASRIVNGKRCATKRYQ